jgi:hypothetical protein
LIDVVYLPAGERTETRRSDVVLLCVILYALSSEY